MKIVTMLMVLSGLLMTTACDDNQKPKINNPFAGHADALQKAKDLKRQVEGMTDKKVQQVNDLN